MDQIVSITSQGQLTIPKTLRELFGIKGAVKAVVSRSGNTIIVKPNGNFWGLSGSLSGKIKLNDKQLRVARDNFAKSWARDN